MKIHNLMIVITLQKNKERDRGRREGAKQEERGGGRGRENDVTRREKVVGLLFRTCTFVTDSHKE